MRTASKFRTSWPPLKKSGKLFCGRNLRAVLIPDRCGRSEAEALRAAYTEMEEAKAEDVRRAGLEGFDRGAESRSTEIKTQARMPR